MPLWGGFVNFVISLISYNVYNIIYYIYVCPCWSVGRLRLGGVGMLYPCAPVWPSEGRKLPPLAVGWVQTCWPSVGGLRLAVGRVPVGGLFVSYTICCLWVGGGTIPNVGQISKNPLAVCLFAPVLAVGLLGRFVCPVLANRGRGLVCCTPVPLLAVCGRFI